MKRFALLFVILTACHSIQEPVALAPAVQGVVYDVATQQPIAGVRIEVSGRIATTAPDGTYYVPDVTSGQQALTASKSGYATYVTDVQVTGALSEKKFYLQPAM